MNNRASAKIILDSISPQDIRLTTFQLRYWRPIHSELMTHRVFSRNAGSSRARPSKTIIDQVRTDPWGPIHWGKNQPGMQAHEEISLKGDAKDEWKAAAHQAAEAAEEMTKLGLHKQIVNRLLEPFTYIDVLVTATDFNNWFALRTNKDAQPEIVELANLMLVARNNSDPGLLEPGLWHLPYITADDWEQSYHFLKVDRVIRSEPSNQEKLGLLRKISAARCARVSYKAFDGTNSSFEKDLDLYEKLVISQPVHASPTEHQATPDEYVDLPTQFCEKGWQNKHKWGNFNGWIQYRKLIPNEYVPG